jgi:hypothetical protein
MVVMARPFAKFWFGLAAILPSCPEGRPCQLLESLLIARSALWPTMGMLRSRTGGHVPSPPVADCCLTLSRRESYEKHRREQVKNIFASLKDILERDFECKGLNSRRDVITQCTLILRTYSDSSPNAKQNWARQRADGTPGLGLMVRWGA